MIVHVLRENIMSQLSLTGELNILVISLRLELLVHKPLCLEAYLQVSRKVLVNAKSIKEDNTKFTVAWEVLVRWKQVRKTATSILSRSEKVSSRRERRTEWLQRSFQ